jgi:hypothetical protein
MDNERGTAQPLALGGIEESEGSSDSQQALLGSTPKPNHVHYDPVNPWQNPANGFAPLSGFTFTLPGATHWYSVRYDANRFSTQNGVAEVNNLEHWYPDFLALPYLVVYDVPLADLLSEHNSLIAQAFDLATQRAPQFWWSRNFSTKPPAAYAAALMRMQDPRGTECVRFIKQHWVMETDKPKNFELVWLTLAEKSLKEPFPR